MIRYEVAAPGQATLAVYDVRGRRVAVLAEGTHARGAHEARWDGTTSGGRPAGAGSYWLRLDVPGAAPLVKRIVRVR